jgi:hypothetical protein
MTASATNVRHADQSSIPDSEAKNKKCVLRASAFSALKKCVVRCRSRSRTRRTHLDAPISSAYITLRVSGRELVNRSKMSRTSGHRRFTRDLSSSSHPLCHPLIPLEDGWMTRAPAVLARCDPATDRSPDQNHRLTEIARLPCACRATDRSGNRSHPLRSSPSNYRR